MHPGKRADTHGEGRKSLASSREFHDGRGAFRLAPVKDRKFGSKGRSGLLFTDRPFDLAADVELRQGWR